MKPQDLSRLGPTPPVQLFRVIIALALRLRALMDSRLSEIGLTTQQAVLLTLVETAPAPPTLGEMAHHLGTSHQNARQLVDALVRKGLLRVGVDRRDRRARRLFLTARVATSFKARNQDDYAAIAGWMGALSPREMSEATSLLVRVYEGLPRGGEDGGDSGHNVTPRRGLRARRAARSTASTPG